MRGESCWTIANLHRRDVLFGTAVSVMECLHPRSCAAATKNVIAELIERFDIEGLTIAVILNASWAARIPGTSRSMQGRFPFFLSPASVAAGGTAIIGLSDSEGIALVALDGSLLARCA